MLYGAEKVLFLDRPIHARQKFRPVTLVSGNIRYMGIPVGVPPGGDLK